MKQDTENACETTLAKEPEMKNTVLLLAKHDPDDDDEDFFDDDDLEKGRRGRASTAASVLTFTQMRQLADNVHEYGLLDTKCNRLLMYIFLLLLYIGLNVALLGANFQDQKFIEDNYLGPFHLADFWGLFSFTALEALILIATDFVSWDNRLQSALVLFNVMMAFAAALLFSFDMELFEVPGHYMEYSIQVLISGVNVFFLNTYVRAASNSSMVYRLRHVEFVVLILVWGLSLFQLSLYAGFPKVSMGAERAAHFCEFINEIFNGLFALVYAVLSYTDVRQQLQEHYIAMKPPSTI